MKFFYFSFSLVIIVVRENIVQAKPTELTADDPRLQGGVDHEMQEIKDPPNDNPKDVGLGFVNLEENEETVDQEQQEQPQAQQQQQEQPSVQQSEHQQDQMQKEVRETIGVIDPEEIMHQGEDHHSHDKLGVHSNLGGEEPCNGTDCQMKLEQAVKSAEARTLAEVAELNNFRPSTRLNVHDPQARDLAQTIEQFGPGDPETMAHGGHLVHGDTGEDTLTKHQALQPPKIQVREELGPTFEQAVHGQNHVHSHTDHTSGSRPVVKYQDIVDLELGDEMLKGIDLSQLLDQERREAAEWRRLSGMEDEDDIIHLEL